MVRRLTRTPGVLLVLHMAMHSVGPHGLDAVAGRVQVLHPQGLAVYCPWEGVMNSATQSFCCAVGSRVDDFQAGVGFLV